MARRLALRLAWLGLSACSSGPLFSEVTHPVARVRVDLVPSGDGARQQFFVAEPKEVDALLEALDLGQHVKRGKVFKEAEFPDIGLTFFDAQGTPWATLNFSGPINAHNELYALTSSIEQVGSVTPADLKGVEAIIARNTPKAR